MYLYNIIYDYNISNYVPTYYYFFLARCTLSSAVVYNEDLSYCQYRHKIRISGDNIMIIGGKSTESCGDNNNVYSTNHVHNLWVMGTLYYKIK